MTHRSAGRIWKTWGLTTLLALLLATGAHLAQEPPPGSVIFVDGFETGDTSSWSDRFPRLTIGFLEPLPGGCLGELRPDVALSYSGPGDLEPDVATLMLSANDDPLAVRCGAAGGRIDCTLLEDLPEGSVVLAASVTDDASHFASSASVSFSVDAGAPLAVDTARVTLTFDGSQVSVSGGPEAAESGASVSAIGPGGGGNTTANLDGSFLLKLGAGAGDSLSLRQTDCAGNTGPSALVTVPGQGEDLPPNPAEVAPPIDPTVATDFATEIEFLTEGPNPIQTGVAPGALDDDRTIAVLRGRVLSRAGAPLPGVKITCHGHPELGETKTRADGIFDLAVSGGGPRVVVYEKDGYLPLQRRLDVPWRDFAWAPDVVMTPLDPAVTAIAANAGSMQVMVGTEVTDEDGTRCPVVLAPAGTDIEMELPDGSMQSLGTASLRVSEFTLGAMGPDAMPADLPPASAYTWAAEISADEAIAAGATEVRFSQPLVLHQENFLGFPIGEPVPTGYYDREKAAWVGVEDGRVIEILSVDGQGRAELDLDGSGQAADAAALADLGVTEAERIELASRYAIGTSLWRVPIPHLTPYDCNWPFQPPGDVELPPADDNEEGDDSDDSDPSDPDGEEDADRDDPMQDEPDCTGGSVIECQNQILGEAVSIPGTGLALHYRSDRTPGRREGKTLSVRVTGPTVPASLQRAEVIVEVAGQRIYETFEPLPNQFLQLSWDGRDGWGRNTNGRTQARIAKRFCYQLEYNPSVGPESRRSWGRFGEVGGIFPSQVRTAGVVCTERVRRTNLSELGAPLTQWDARNTGLGGWTLSPHHTYDPDSRSLYLGTGDRRTPRPFGVASKRAVGTGEYSSNGDFGPAEQAAVRRPWSIAVAPNGTLYLADVSSGRVRQVSPDGIITTFAGGGGQCTEQTIGDTATECGNGGPAHLAKLSHPASVAVEENGGVLIGDIGTDCVRRVAPDGTISTVAGDCFFNFLDLAVEGLPSGRATPDLETSALGCDGCPATSVSLRWPGAVLATPGGGFWVADTNNHQVLRVTPDGMIEREVGDPTATGLGDGGMARSARLSNPTGLARDAEGNLYIADRGHDRIRRVTPAGVITTVAGNGGTTFDPASEGQQATAVAVPDGKSVTVRRDGTIVIASLDRLLAVDPDGRLRTLLGGGTANPIVAGVPSLNGDFGNLWSPNEMPDGTLAVGDGFLSVVFQIGEPLPGYSGDEIRIPNPSGTEVWVFDRQGRHLKTVDSLTQADLWAFAYDAEGRLLTLTDGDNLTTAIERIAGVPKALIGPYGHRTELGLDPNGWLNDVTTPAGRQQTFRYTEDGLMDRHTDARGATSEYLFSETGHLIAATNRAGTTQTFTRFGFGEDYRVLQTSPSGLATRYHVNRQGSGATENTRTRSDGFATTTSRSADGTRQQVAPDGTVTTTRLAADPRFGMTSAIAAEVVTTTPGGKTRVTQHDRAVTLGDPLDPLSVTSMIDTVTVNGKTSTRAWDAATRTYTLTSPEGRIVTVKVDEQRRPLETKLPGFLAVEMSYDTDGLVRSIAQGSGTDRREMAFDYDLLGRLETHTDPEARTTTYTHDPDDLPSSQVLPGNRTLGLGFDGNGNLNRVTPPGRPDHTFEYTPDDLPELYRPPTLGGNFESSSSTFDNDRRPELITRAGRQEVDLGYDPEGRLESIAVDGDALTYGYSDTTGQLESLTGPAAAPDRQALTYGFDGFLPTSTTWSGPVAGSVARSFDDDFRLTTESVNGLHTVTFVYDDDGLLEGAGDLDLIRSASSGFLTGTALQSVTTATGYSPFGEISSLSATAVSTEIFRIDVPVRDSLGRIVETRETIQGVTDTVIYDYDPAGRLETVTKNGTLVATYGYDANGNRTSFSSPNETITAVVHDDQDRLTTYGDLTFTYKKSGELATKTQNGQTVQYGYDAFGNLRTVDLPDGISIEYLVDGEGRRIGKKVQGVLGQGFLYGDRLNPIAELDSSGAVLSRFVYGSKGWVPDYLVKGGVTYRILSDLRGSVRLVVDAATGAIVQRLDFDEYGRVLQDTNPGFQPFGYAGGLWDPQTGLVRFGARDYDPEIGRWTAKDPIGFAGGDTNLYAYVANDPINLIDPSGEIAPLAVLYLLAEIGFTIYDIYDLLNTLQDPTVSDCEKLLTAIGATLGIAAVGGGYGWLARKLYRWYKARKAADLLKDVAKRQSRKAPNQVPPGVRTLEGQYIDDLGRVQPWKAHYDEYGRQVGRTDFNAGNRSQGIPDTHYHRTEYSAQFPHGKSAGDHVPGEFPGVRP